MFSFANKEDLGAFRQGAIDDVSGAKVYLLDIRSASYLDSLRETMGHDLDAVDRITKLMSEVSLPSELIWVECDYKQLEIDRINRRVFGDGDLAKRLSDAEVMGLRGYLIDNRLPEYLKITQFRAGSDGKVIDPLTHLLYDKDSAGQVSFERFKTIIHPHMKGFFTHPFVGASEETLAICVRDEVENAAYDLALPYLLFAEISSEDQVIIREEQDTLSRREQKTAKKFGKDVDD